MSKRILLEITPNPKSAGSMLDFIVELGVFLNEQEASHIIDDYGIALETPVTWFVKISAKAEKCLEEAQK